MTEDSLNQGYVLISSNRAKLSHMRFWFSSSNKTCYDDQGEEQILQDNVELLTWSYSLMAVKKMIAFTSSKQ